MQCFVETFFNKEFLLTADAEGVIRIKSATLGIEPRILEDLNSRKDDDYTVRSILPQTSMFIRALCRRNGSHPITFKIKLKKPVPRNAM